MFFHKASADPDSLGHSKVRLSNLTWLAAHEDEGWLRRGWDLAPCSKSSQRLFTWLGFLLEPCLACVAYPYCRLARAAYSSGLQCPTTYCYTPGQAQCQTWGRGSINVDAMAARKARSCQGATCPPPTTGCFVTIEDFLRLQGIGNDEGRFLILITGHISWW